MTGVYETVSYAYNSANELTSMTDGNGTTAFTYDDWGRMTGKSRGGLSATYGYDYGGKLVSVDSDFLDEGSVAYDYGGDGKRRLRTAGTVETWYNWAGWHVIQEEDDAAGDGDLARTYVGRALAQIDGTDPATGTARYFLHDHLGSTREIRTAGKALDGQFDYTPYGTAFNASHTDATTRRFTGHDYDPASALYFAPFRHYAPDLARWTTRDPLGMVDGPNVYAYVGGNPVGGSDPLGLRTCVRVSFWATVRLQVNHEVSRYLGPFEYDPGSSLAVLAFDLYPRRGRVCEYIVQNVTPIERATFVCADVNTRYVSRNNPVPLAVWTERRTRQGTPYDQIIRGECRTAWVDRNANFGFDTGYFDPWTNDWVSLGSSPPAP